MAKRKVEGNSNGMSKWGAFTLAKELIFEIEEDKPTLYIVLHTINVDNLQIEIAPTLQYRVDGEDPADIKEDIKGQLALARALDVPVYPNREELGPELARYHRDLLIEGFRMLDESGEYRTNTG